MGSGGKGDSGGQGTEDAQMDGESEQDIPPKRPGQHEGDEPPSKRPTKVEGTTSALDLAEIDKMLVSAKRLAEEVKKAPVVVTETPSLG